jgi:perosamine synthetase
MIPLSEPNLTDRELEYLVECFQSTWISGKRGKYIELFERNFADFCGAKYAVCTPNGTSALRLALQSLRIGEGDEVIVPSHSYVASANAIVQCHATPVFADCDEFTWGLDPASVETNTSPRTKAIMPVHIYGHPVDMDPILEIARGHGVYVVENACEAHGATYKDKKCGSIGDIGCFSFFASKVITTGEGGMITTNDQAIYETAKLLKDQATERDVGRWWHCQVGDSLRLSNLLAAIGVAQLERIEELLAIKRQNARRYWDLLSDVPGIKLRPEAPWAKSAFHMYCILVDKEFAMSRDQLVTELAHHQIETAPFFTPLHLLPPYEGLSANYPVTERVCAKGLCLPSSTRLTEDDIQRVAGAIRDIAER